VGGAKVASGVPPLKCGTVVAETVNGALRAKIDRCAAEAEFVEGSPGVETVIRAESFEVPKKGCVGSAGGRPQRQLRIDANEPTKNGTVVRGTSQLHRAKTTRGEGRGNERERASA
jgi:hypothetical protein